MHSFSKTRRIDKIIGLFCRIASLLEGSFAKETYNFIDPTNQRHPICIQTQMVNAPGFGESDDLSAFFL